jgi:hypothetical protein
VPEGRGKAGKRHALRARRSSGGEQDGQGPAAQIALVEERSLYNWSAEQLPWLVKRLSDLACEVRREIPGASLEENHLPNCSELLAKQQTGGGIIKPPCRVRSFHLFSLFALFRPE